MGARFEVAFQLWVLTNRGCGFGSCRFDEGAAVADADLAAERRFRLQGDTQRGRHWIEIYKCGTQLCVRCGQFLQALGIHVELDELINAFDLAEATQRGQSAELNAGTRVDRQVRIGLELRCQAGASGKGPKPRSPNPIGLGKTQPTFCRSP